MRVYCEKTGRDAKKRKDNDSGELKYFATPSGENKKISSKLFDTIDELGLFLIQNPDHKVYVGDAQINTDIVVEGKICLRDLKASK